MLAKFRGHLRSNVVAYLALFFALSAPAAALFMVTGADIKDGTVTGADVKNESLTGVDVLNDSLKGADVDEASLSGVNADNLDGVDSTGFLGANAKAADADKLDGKNSTAFASLGGIVNGSGFFGTASPGLTLQKFGTGQYAIGLPDGTIDCTLDTTPPDLPVPVVGPVEAASLARVTASSCLPNEISGQFTVQTTDLDGVAKNADFSFIVLG